MKEKTGFLKKFFKGLKLTATTIPLAIAVAMPVTAITCISVASVTEPKIFEEIVETENFATARDADLEELTQKYKAGEISNGDYNDELGKFGTKTYIKEFLKQDFEGNAEYLTRLKNNDVLFYLGMGAFVGFIFTTIGATYFELSVASKMRKKILGTYEEEEPKIEIFQDCDDEDELVDINKE